MKRQALIPLLLILSVAVTMDAADKPAKGKKKADQTAQKGAPKTGQLLLLPKQIELTEEQTEKLKDLQKKHEPAAKDLQKKMNEALSAEYKKARAELMKAAKAAGKTQKEIQTELKALDETLTAEERETVMALRKEMREFKQKFLAEASEFLTDDQKAQLPKPNQGGKKKKAE